MSAARILSTGLLAAALAATAAEAASAPAQSALAADGIFYRVQAGRFVDLFGAENQALPPENQVLALDLVRPGQAVERWIVPGTEGVEFESSPALLFEEETSTLEVVWNRDVGGNFPHSQLVLRALGPEGWREEIDLSAGSSEQKRSIRLLVTADRYQTTVAGEAVEVARRILHLLWVEPSESGLRPYYSALVFVGGEYVGWNPVVALENLVAAETASPLAATASLAEAPTLASGRGDGGLVAGFVDPRTQRVATAEIRVLPAELGQLADEARGSIIALAALYPNDLPRLAQEARGSIIALGAGFHPAALAHIADTASGEILLANPGSPPAQLADEARGSIIALANQIDGGGLSNGCADEGALVEIPPLVPSEGRDLTHLIQLRPVRALDAPAIDAAPPTLLVSPDGSRALVGWVDGSTLIYLESLPDGTWGPRLSLDLAWIPLSDALAALEWRLARP